MVFALAALAFLLPFATVSCDEAETSFTGIQLATFTVPQGGYVDEPPDCTDELSSCVEGQGSALAAIALLAALVGFGLGLFPRRGGGWCAAMGLAAMLILFANSGALSFSLFTGPDVTFHSGYWLILLLFVWAGALHVRRAARRMRERFPTGERNDVQPAIPAGSRVCVTASCDACGVPARLSRCDVCGSLTQTVAEAAVKN